ncbi:MAG: 3-dehydroquinate dehydratase [Flavobacteriales bacterium]|jgi:3-dehydroquinate dehydratase-2|nr:3-dehydroquinate dehydratase [Flavobacteriales bacterium]NCG30511.1 type II 3-dehydroquinate dehydratase [Bacteroidota bacterium]MBT3962707.1 3-dehydroquinate dehydratase [Flavobacteriales bacterium]MBT4704170.1 3-dehydroquinate dehydratase [Flavobacteriales bacterium]MBT4930010.1 3-dehydroquinate dehydratase [Flavobacteriales bacterium]
MKIAIVNGPNLNLTGSREKDVYGERTFEQLITELNHSFPKVEIVYLQSNVEGELINFLHELDEQKDVLGVLLNGGGYTHTSVALGDAVAAISKPVIEIHMSNVFAREDFRHVSYIGGSARGTIAGFGMESYILGVIKMLNEQA